MTDWDDEYDHSRPKEEPDCFECSDTGRRRNGRRCPWCDPSRWQQWLAAVGWWAWRLRRRLRAWAGRPDSEGAPF